MKILRATASKDLSVHPNCTIVRHPLHGRECLRVGMEHWIPVVSWVRLHESPDERVAEESQPNEESNGPSNFEQLDSSNQVEWVDDKWRG